MYKRIPIKMHIHAQFLFRLRPSEFLIRILFVINSHNTFYGSTFGNSAYCVLINFPYREPQIVKTKFDQKDRASKHRVAFT